MEASELRRVAIWVLIVCRNCWSIPASVEELEEEESEFVPPDELDESPGLLPPVVELSLPPVSEDDEKSNMSIRSPMAGLLVGA